MRTRRSTRTRTRLRLRPSPSPSPSPSPKRSQRSSVVTSQDIQEAAEGLRGVARRTRLIYVEELGAHLKLENEQPVGAFKIRGAYNAIRKLPDPARKRGVITFSSGNHGQAVAYAAKQFGVRAVIVMPETAPAVKVEGVKRWGGEVVLAGRTSEDRRTEAGAPVRLERTASIADGLITLNVGDIPFAELEAHRDRLRGVVLVEDDSIRDAVQFLWRTCQLAVEPSGVATTAALLSGAVRPSGVTVLVVSGGNIDRSLLED